MPLDEGRELQLPHRRAGELAVRARPVAGKAFLEVGADIDRQDEDEAASEAFGSGASRDGRLKRRVLQ